MVHVIAARPRQSTPQSGWLRDVQSDRIQVHWLPRRFPAVFDKQEFKNYARQNLVLVELDFPQRKKLPAAIKAQNNRLRDKYGIRGYPTIILLDARGNKLGKTGYVPGGPSAFISEVKRITQQ